MITGRHNPKLVRLRKAIRAGTLTEDGLLPVEGIHLIEEAILTGHPVEEVFRAGSARGRTWPPSRVLPAEHVLDDATFRSIQSTETSQGWIGLVRVRENSLSSVIDSMPSIIIVLCRLQDPGNVGTILRSADAFGASCIGLHGTAGLHSPKVVRSSAGSLFRVPAAWNISASDAFPALRAAGYRLLGATPSAGTLPRLTNWSGAAALLIGNEGEGLNDLERGFCDESIHVPHTAGVESLNSAVAASILLYEAWMTRNAPS